ncbi:unnamed protein product [Paramecium primaurelia]|uniref:Uncharacterized protein n=1 Tax=Paramecium primaurelia TaxID=5886 RepID=A0A8S1QKY8_PARPR|nr:unnamed protein product [Paramecium primaurelia]
MQNQINNQGILLQQISNILYSRNNLQNWKLQNISYTYKDVVICNKKLDRDCLYSYSYILRSRANQHQKTQIKLIIDSITKKQTYSYIVESDEVHYPLPLNYNEQPNIQQMMNTIIKLREENQPQTKQLQTLLESKKNEYNPLKLINEQNQEIQFLNIYQNNKIETIWNQKTFTYQQTTKQDYNELRSKYLQSQNTKLKQQNLHLDLNQIQKKLNKFHLLSQTYHLKHLKNINNQIYLKCKRLLQQMIQQI